MKMRNKYLAVAGLALTVWAADVVPAVPYPAGYRQWKHLHSTVVTPAHGTFGKEPCTKPCTAGIFHFYGNEKAMEGFRTGTFADGAIFADEVLELHLPDGGASAKEGPRRVVGVMVKDSRLYTATGGWGYGAFSGESRAERLSAAEKQACFQCHVGKKDRDYVFTEYRER